MPQTRPFGSWSSPISPSHLASTEVMPIELDVHDGTVMWVEMRPTEQGRYVLVSNDGGANTSWTPESFNVRTRVHEYGGHAFCVSNGTVYFSNYADQRLYRQRSADDEPEAVTEEPADKAAVRYADMDASKDGRWLVCVRETHGDEVVNEIVSIDTQTGAQEVLASGADFYAHPRLDPDDAKLAYVTWDHPNMPWDTTELYVTAFSNGAVGGEPQKVAGGTHESVIQPSWSRSGILHFVSDRTDWWNIYRFTDDGVQAVCPLDAEFGTPMWELGLQNYCFLEGDRIIAICTESAVDCLGVIEGGSFTPLDTAMQEIHAVRTDGKTIAVIGGGPKMALGVHKVDVTSTTIETIEPGMDIDLDEAHISIPETIEFSTEGGVTAHALYYPPSNGDFEGTQGELPPLLVYCHGGPTGHRSPLFDYSLQFWTTRGFGVVDVNYGGSSGYGRDYRERLKGNWGVVDIADCVAAARFLIDRGDVDPDRVAIRGGSAGGYTTLSSLAFTDFYAAGASHFGLGDLEAFVDITHKFEERYLEALVGPYPEAAETYRARSAVPHAEQIECPVILFQGLEDEVVPPAQAEQVVEALEEKGLPYAYLAFEGEQHGFRRSESKERVAGAELYFYAKVFNFDAPADIEPIEINNL